VVFFLVHVLVRRFARLVAGGGGAAALEVENAVLRHQLRVLRRSAKRPGLRRRDRLVLAAASELLPRQVVGVSGLAADAAALAAGTGAAEVDVSAPTGGPTAARPRATGARAAVGEGESALGLRADPGRVAQARRPGGRDDDPHAPPTARAGAGPAPNRAVLGGVLARAGARDPGLRFLHRRDCLAADAVRALLDRTRFPPRPRRRRDRESRLRLGEPAGAQPRNRRSP